MNKLSIADVGVIVGIVSTIIGGLWFIISRPISRYRKDRKTFFDEIPGSYGAWINPTDTIEKSIPDKTRYEGGLLLEIYKIDAIGRFEATSHYHEEKITMYPDQPGRGADSSQAHGSIPSFTGQIKYRWHYKFWNNNRVYFGVLNKVTRLDDIQGIIDGSAIEMVYNVKYLRDNSTLICTFKERKKECHSMPTGFDLIKKSPHPLDRYTNVSSSIIHWQMMRLNKRF
jgi:hypothetical protein